MRTLLAGVALAAATVAGLAGCGGGSHQSGVQAFIKDVRSSGVVVQSATDDQIASLGESGCQALAVNDYGATVQGTTGAGVTSEQADKLIRSAVRNLCPQYAEKLP